MKKQVSNYVIDEIVQRVRVDLTLTIGLVSAGEVKKTAEQRPDTQSDRVQASNPKSKHGCDATDTVTYCWDRNVSNGRTCE